MTVLWALYWIGRLGETEALGLSWPEDAAVVDVSRLLQTASLSDAWTCGQTSQLREQLHNYITVLVKYCFYAQTEYQICISMSFQ